MKIIYFGQRSGSRSRPIVAATEGCGLRGGGRERVSRAEWKFGNGWVSMNHQSTVTRSPFLSIYRVGYGAGLLPR